MTTEHARKLECPHCGKLLFGAAGLEQHLIFGHELGPRTAHDTAGKVALESVPEVAAESH